MPGPEFDTLHACKNGGHGSAHLKVSAGEIEAGSWGPLLSLFNLIG